MLLREAPPPSVRLSGAARARTGAAGDVVRTVRGKVLTAAFQNITAGSGFDTANTYSGAVYDGSHFFAYRSNGNSSCRSADGLNWVSNAAAPFSFQFNTPEFAVSTNGAGTLLAGHGIASTTNLWRSTDHGASWTVCGAQPVSGIWLPIYGNGIWMAIQTGGAGTLSAAISTDDGLTWQFATGTHTVGNPVNALAFGNGVWIITSNEVVNNVSRDNGQTWFLVSNGAGGNILRGVYFNKNLNVFAAANGGGGGAVYAGSGPSIPLVPGNIDISGSDVKSVGNWIATPSGKLYSPSTGILGGNSFQPHAYGNGYYVRLPSIVGPQPDRATEPLLTYAEVVE